MVWLIEHEPLINVVIDSKLKMLTSLTKRDVVGSGVRSSPDADKAITGGEAGPNPCMVLMWNVVNRCAPHRRQQVSATDVVGIVGRSHADPTYPCHPA
jgi:hypothetical protein